MREVLKAAVQAMVVVMICVAILLLGCSCKENSDETVIGNDKVVKVMMKILPLDMNCLLFLRVTLWMKKLLETFLPVMIEEIGIAHV